jgi:hypothetical protein
VSIKNLDTAETLNGAFVASPSMPTSEGEDIWQAIAQVNFIPADWTHIKITLENELFANSQPGSATYIEKKVLDSSITMQNIPEPATVVMLSIGAAFMFRDFLKRKSAI